MLPAETIAEITTNLAALQLEPNTAAQILAAVLAPLIRSTDPEPPVRPRKHAKPRKAAQQKRKYKRGAPDARDRAHAALKANPGMSWTRLAAIAGVSRGTVANAARGAAASKQARRRARQASTTADAKTEARARAQRFLKDALAHGPKPVTDVEAAAAAPPSATSNSRRPMVTVIRPSRARRVKETIPRHERAVLHPGAQAKRTPGIGCNGASPGLPLLLFCRRRSRPRLPHPPRVAASIC
jgi:hypothetical protein